jgi:zinc/manganese transport system permease protein
MSEGLSAGILLPALAAGLLVLATHVPLGAEVLRRGVVFLDLAVAQIAALGALFAHLLGAADRGWAMQAAALAAALAGALFLVWTERKAPARQEALIGATFVVCASVAILALARHGHAGEHLQDMLVGQILWTTWGDLVPLAAVSAAVLCAWYGMGLRRSPVGFYVLFAVAITASVQAVGVYLVFASLVLPALASHGREAKGYAVGAAGYALGLVASALFDLPSGAAIVVALAAVAALAFPSRHLTPAWPRDERRPRVRRPRNTTAASENRNFP